MNLLLPQRYLPVGKTYFVNFSIKSRTFLTSITLLMLLSFQTYGQDNWTLSAEKDGVKIFYQLSVCDTEPVALLKFENNTSDSLRIEWFEYAQLEGVEEEFKLTESGFILNLSGNQTIEGSCEPDQYLQTKSRPSIFYDMQNRSESDTSSFANFKKHEIQSFRVEIQSIEKLN